MGKTDTLRTGYTTGTCAAAAARGALLCLQGKEVHRIDLTLPGGDTAVITPQSARLQADAGRCSVVKDAGDDPDSTHGAVISAEVRLVAEPGISIKGGAGVGTVTRPGLAIPPGEPAINPVPRQMIRDALSDLVPDGQGAEVTISVAGGEDLAKKTLNPRLGIVGGISILGTTGIVVPYSHDAYRESITCAFDVLRAQGESTTVLSTGKSSEKSARSFFSVLSEACFVLMGDYFSFAVREAAGHGMQKIILACFPGKLVKIAGGAGCTHFSKSDIDLVFLSEVAAKTGVADAVVSEIRQANTVRHACEMLEKDTLKAVCTRLAEMALRMLSDEAGGNVAGEVLVLSYDAEVLCHVC